MAHLEIFKKGTKSGEFPLSGVETLIGRDKSAQVRLDDHIVSRKHARIVVADGGFVLEDLGTRNGTFVNGNKEFRRTLKDGDALEFGPYVLKFRMAAGEKVPVASAAPSEKAGPTARSAKDPEATRNIEPKELARVREEARNSLQPHLQEQSGTTPRVHVLKKDKVLLGAGDEADLRVKDSGRDVAAEFTRKGAAWTVSKSGFFATMKVNGEKVSEHVLKDGDRIEVGTVVLIFRAGAQQG